MQVNMSANRTSPALRLLFRRDTNYSSEMGPSDGSYDYFVPHVSLMLLAASLLQHRNKGNDNTSIADSSTLTACYWKIEFSPLAREYNPILEFNIASLWLCKPLRFTKSLRADAVISVLFVNHRESIPRITLGTVVRNGGSVVSGLGYGILDRL
ncbi:hypothetical protein NM688_g3726 [Phlebia brevispora]|uniref:Uncharacterized protein n=1 Tax=Phlebia brevispora TaxID=194682 RepID=A0ACC1T4W2_9APHY|nr:hypothetical protein NM688_g3726 [Phlebia brevispora]